MLQTVMQKLVCVSLEQVLVPSVRIQELSDVYLTQTEPFQNIIVAASTSV